VVSGVGRQGRRRLWLAVAALACLPAGYLTYVYAQRQASRPRRAAAAGAQVFNVKAGADLQRALDAAEPGDELVLEAGATFTGNFTLPIKSGAAFITVRSSRCAELPAGRRVSPRQAALMARLVTPNVGPVLLAPPGSHHWRFACLEFTQGPSVAEPGYNLVQLGDGDRNGAQKTLGSVPHHFELDRVVVRARDARAAVQRGVTLNSAHTSITNSHVSGIKWQGVETQAVGGWNGPGPFLIENNYLEAAGVNVLFGGAPVAVPGLVPSDIVIRRNHLFKPLSWRAGDPAYAGVEWTVKNLLELKSARRVTVEGNLLENCWPQAQTGWAVIFNALGEYGGAEAVEDVEFVRNVIRNTSNGVNLRGMEATDRAARMRRVRFAHNLLEQVGVFGGEGKVFQLLNGTEAVTIDHNTVAGRVSSVLLLDAAGQFRHEEFSFTNNLAPHGAYGVFGAEGALGTAAFEKFCRRWRFAGNLLAGADPNTYPPGNLYPPAFDPNFFADAARGNYRVTHPRFKGRAADGRDPGCDFDALEAALSWRAQAAG
jgi:hypothetical protein